jgi:hypothetical protein
MGLSHSDCDFIWKCIVNVSFAIPNEQQTGRLLYAFRLIYICAWINLIPLSDSDLVNAMSYQVATARRTVPRLAAH